MGKPVFGVKPRFASLHWMPYQLVSHPLYLHKLSLLRDERVRPKQFRELVNEMTTLVVIKAAESLDLTTSKELCSPMETYMGMQLKDQIGCFPIMRAGNGMVPSFLNMIPNATVHHLGLFREKSTKLPVEYYNKLPATCKLDVGFILDPMIATAGYFI